MERSPKKGRFKSGASLEESVLLASARCYAKALEDSIEFPSPENTQKVLEMSRDVMLRAAQLMSQETLEKLGKIQQDRIMKNG